MSNIDLRQGFAPTTMAEAVQFSEMLASSSMVPKQYQGKANDVLVCVQWGYEMGLAPMQALQNIAVINGKPSVYGDAAMALVQNSPVCEDIQEFFEDEGTQNPVAVCVAQRRGRKPVTGKFSVEDAKRAGLWGKQGPWTQYPKRMLQMRARGFALRDAFPDVLKGLITSEEAMDYPIEEKRVEKVLDPIPTITFESMQQTEEGRYKIKLPDGTIYSSHADEETWIEAYVAMVNRIRNSGKMNEEQKNLKIDEFRTANEETRKSLSAGSAVLLAKMSKKTQEEAHDPKPEAPTYIVEPSESEF